MQITYRAKDSEPVHEITIEHEGEERQVSAESAVGWETILSTVSRLVQDLLGEPSPSEIALKQALDYSRTGQSKLGPVP